MRGRDEKPDDVSDNHRIMATGASLKAASKIHRPPPLRRPQWLLAIGLVAGSAIAFECRAQNTRLDTIAALRREAVGYEHGDGLAKDVVRAAVLYCEAARLGDPGSQFDLGWMFLNGRGLERDDAAAAFLFRMAAAGGIGQAVNLLRVLPTPAEKGPACLSASPDRTAPAENAAVAMVTPPLPAGHPIVALVQKTASEMHVPQALIWAIMRTESNFDARAVSPKNARGLMQLIPETATRFRVNDPFDPAQNIRGGVSYLRWLLAYFQGDVALVAAAYNAGEGAVDRYRGVPPYDETREYVRRIVMVVGSMVQPFDAGVTEPSPVLRRRKQEPAQR